MPGDSRGTGSLCTLEVFGPSLVSEVARKTIPSRRSGKICTKLSAPEWIGSTIAFGAVVDSFRGLELLPFEYAGLRGEGSIPVPLPPPLHCSPLYPIVRIDSKN